VSQPPLVIDSPRPAPGRTASPARGLIQRVERADILALSLLLVLALLTLSRQVVVGGALDNRDIALQSLPVYSWYAEHLRQGAIPVWAPAILGGFPLAFAQYGFFYPPDMLLFWLIDAGRAFHLSLALHLAAAGCATYWYCRVLGIRRLPSLLAAVAFQMGNEPLAWPANGFITKTLFVLPALLATVELMRRRGPRYWLLIPPIVGAGLLVGYAQFVFLGLLVSGTYLLVLTIISRRSDAPRASAGRIALFGLGALLGAGLAAVRVLPTTLVTDLSVRAGGLSFDQSAVESIKPLGLLLGSLLPAAYELPLDLGGRPDYVGPAVLVLALLAAAFARTLGYAGRFHLALAATAGLLSLGRYTPLYELALHLPFFSYFRVPGRFSIIAALAISVLAALALDRYLAQRLPGRGLRYRALVGTAAATTALLAAGLALSLAYHYGWSPPSSDPSALLTEGRWDAISLLRVRVALPLLALASTLWMLVAVARGRIPARVFEWSALSITAVTLFALGWLLNPWLPPSVAHAPLAFEERIKRDPELFRVFAWLPGVSGYNSKRYFTETLKRLPDPDFDMRYSREYLPPNTGMPLGMFTPDGYEVLQTRRQALVATYMGSERQDSARFSDGSAVETDVYLRSVHDRLDLLALLNVKYVTFSFPVESPRLEQLDQVKVAVYADAPHVTAMVYLYQLAGTFPRALVVPESVTAGGEAEALEMVSARAVDPRRTVVLEEAAPALDGARLAPGASEVEIEHYGNERVVLRARTDGAGYLVLMDFLLPGWTATVNGRQEEILAANFAGRAVPIRGPGEHEVVFSYEAPLLREGLVLSFASLLGMVALVLVAAVGAQGGPLLSSRSGSSLAPRYHSIA
jgi:hypothetical protein